MEEESLPFCLCLTWLGILESCPTTNHSRTTALLPYHLTPSPAYHTTAWPGVCHRGTSQGRTGYAETMCYRVGLTYRIHHAIWELPRAGLGPDWGREGNGTWEGGAEEGPCCFTPMPGGGAASCAAGSRCSGGCDEILVGGHFKKSTRAGLERAHSHSFFQKSALCYCFSHPRVCLHRLVKLVPTSCLPCRFGRGIRVALLYSETRPPLWASKCYK